MFNQLRVMPLEGPIKLLILLIEPTQATVLTTKIIRLQFELCDLLLLLLKQQEQLNQISSDNLGGGR